MWQLYMAVGFCWNFCDDWFGYVKFRENNDVVDFFVGLGCFGLTSLQVHKSSSPQVGNQISFGRRKRLLGGAMRNRNVYRLHFLFGWLIACCLISCCPTGRWVVALCYHRLTPAVNHMLSSGQISCIHARWCDLVGWYVFELKCWRVIGHREFHEFFLRKWQPITGRS